MNPAVPAGAKPGIVHMKSGWKLRQNPFPQSGIAVLGGEEARDNGLLFRPEVQQEHIREAIDKFVLGAAYSGLKFGYLWSLGGAGSGAGDARGFGKSVVLQYLVENINRDFGRSFLIQAGLDDRDADEAPLAAMLASFDMANARSLAAVFYEATRHACRFHVPGEPTLARRIYERLCKRAGTDNETALVEVVLETADSIRGRTLGPPKEDFLHLLCRGDDRALGRDIEQVKEGTRGRVGSANYLATFLLFARAAGIPHVLLGCDQLEDFAATSTAKQKRSVETERFRDFVLELQPMADMLSVIVTLHPRAEGAIAEMWALADLPSLRWDLPENERHVVVLREIHDLDRARALLEPYVQAARKEDVEAPDAIWPLTEDAIQAVLDRSQGRPREILRRAHALIAHGADQNWEQIDGASAEGFLDALVLPDDHDDDVAAPVRRATAVEDQWVE